MRRNSLVYDVALCVLGLIFAACTQPMPTPTSTGTKELQPMRGCIDFDELVLETKYQVPASFSASGATGVVLPFQWGNGAWTSTGDGLSVKNALDAGGSGKEVFANNVNLGFNTDPSQCISLRFHDKGGNVNLIVNNQVGNFPDFVDTNLGSVAISATYDTNGMNSGILTLTGRLETFMFQEKWPISFAIGGQELAIDHLCPC